MQQTRKRRKSADDTEHKRKSSSTFTTPITGQREQQRQVCDSSHWEQWDVDDVASFLSSKGFDKYAPIFQSKYRGRVSSDHCTDWCFLYDHKCMNGY